MSTTKKTVQKVEEVAEPICVSQGLELVHVEYQREPSGRVLRVFIDHPDGIGLDQCTAFSRALSDVLDVYETVEEAYTLEISSPGIERPISKPKDFERFEGKTAKIRMTSAIDGQKTFTGTLLGVSGENVLLRTQQEKEVALPLADIAKARLVIS